MNITYYILFAILGIFFFTLQIAHFIVIYQRKIKSYEEAIQEFLNREQATLYRINYPDFESDWKNGPFKKKSNKITFSLLVFEINNRPVSWTEKHYRIILTNENRKFWLEIETSYFKKPLLVFKEEKNYKKQLKIEEEIKIIEVRDVCPACHSKLKVNENECPNCQLNFN